MPPGSPPGSARPSLRRHGRALTGSQDSGGRLAAATPEALLEDIGAMQSDPDPRVALLMHVIERFSRAEVGRILQSDAAAAAQRVAVARRAMERSVAGGVGVIEDAAIIAMDIADIVRGIGHAVTGIACTRDAAVAPAARDRPDLILADFRLADNATGIDAVNDILARFGQAPVIFITACPERLPTGTRPEPAVLIAKPFTEDRAGSAVRPAMFFPSTAPLAA